LGFESNVKHIEEIKAAGYDLPSVNQIEVINANFFFDFALTAHLFY